MEEKQFFEEMKPLLKDYMEFTKEDMSEKWENMEKEALAKVEESQARVDEAKERQDEAIKNKDIFEEVMPRLKALGEKVYKPVEDERRENQKRLEEYARQYNRRNEELAQANEEVEQTRARIEEEKQERIDTQKEKQESVYAKAKEYIDSTKDTMRRSIEEKSSQLEEMIKQRRELASEAKIASDLTLTIRKSADEVKKSETYKAFSKNAEEELQKRKAMYKAYNQEVRQAREELEGAEAQLASFEEKYDVIDFASETGIQSLIEITGWEEKSVIAQEQGNDLEEPDKSKETEKVVEEETIHKLTEDEVEVVEDNKTDLSREEIDRILSDENVEMVDETQEQTIEEQEETPVEKPEKDWSKMTEEEKWDAIKEIYKEREEGYGDLLSPDYLVQKYKNLAMKDVDEAMKIALTTKGKTLLEIYENCLGKLEKEHPHYQRLVKTVNKVKERDEVLQMTESHDDELLSPSEKAFLEAQNGEKKCLVAALELMYREKEQNFEDLLIPAYNENIRMEMYEITDSYSEEEVKNKLLAMVSKTLKDICLEQLEVAKKQNDKETVKRIKGMIKRVEKREKDLQKANKQKEEKEQEESNPVGQNPTAQNLARQNPTAQNPARQNPTAQNPVRPNPVQPSPTRPNPTERNENGNISIRYLIESDSYEVMKENQWGGTYWNIIKRSELDAGIDEDPLNKINAMDDTFLDVLKCLYKMDQAINTTMMNDYIDVITNSISKAEASRLMKEKGIDVRYDLKGQAVSKEVRKQMEQVARVAKSMGMAKVKSGFFSGILNRIQGMVGKFKNKTKLLDRGENQKKFSLFNRRKKQDMDRQVETEKTPRNKTPREKLQMERYNIDHESAMQNTQSDMTRQEQTMTIGDEN